MSISRNIPSSYYDFINNIHEKLQQRNININDYIYSASLMHSNLFAIDLTSSVFLATTFIFIRVCTWKTPSSYQKYSLLTLMFVLRDTFFMYAF